MIRVIDSHPVVIGEVRWFSYAGTSADEKPTEGVATGSEFKEVDTGTKFLYDEENEKWTAASGGGGGGSSANNVVPGVKFIDYDGTELHFIGSAQVSNMKSLPNNPSHEGLTAQGWNWSLADIKEYMADYPDAVMTVGQMYITDDGKTRMVMDVGPRMTIPLAIQQTVSEGVTIDWGDGTSTETIQGTGIVTTSHTYANEGEYTVTFAVADGCVLDFGGVVSDTNYNVFNERTSGIILACNIKELYIGNGVSGIGDYAFYGCNSLEKITIHEDITSIGTASIFNCYVLPNIIIPNGVTSIGQNSFGGCYRAKSISIPNSMTDIGVAAFYNCFAATSIAIPNGITEINSYSFYSCESSVSITIPNGVESIGDYAFHMCSHVRNIKIPDGVTGIGSYAFYLCRAADSITIPNSVESIGSYAFLGGYILQDLKISDSITSIEQFAFYCAYHIKNIVIPHGVTGIGKNAFGSYSSLVSLTIPETVTSIAANAFNQCGSLYEITILAEIPPTIENVNAFSKMPSDCTIYVPHGKGDTYKAASGWSTWASQIQELPE